MFTYSKIIDHNHPNRNVVVNAAQTKHRYVFQNEDGTETHEIDAHVYHVYATLYNKLLDNQFQTTPVFFKDSDVRLAIIPVGHAPEYPVQQFSDIATFQVTGSYKPVLTFTSLLDLAVILTDYPKFVKDIAYQKSELQAFYDINLKNQSICDYNLGSDFHYEAEQDYFYKQLHMNFQDFLNNIFIPSFAKKHNLNKDFITHALRIYDNWQEYANRYVLLYGETPTIPRELKF